MSKPELATGLHHRNDAGAWVDSQALIEPCPGGAVAQHGQHKVHCKNNLASEGAVELRTPDGITLRSNVRGLSYYDAASGTNVLFAVLKENCPGEIVPPNQVIYRDAFEGLAGTMTASVRYTYTIAGLEQDIIIESRIPDPQDLSSGLDPASCFLQVLTELTPDREPNRSPRRVRLGSGATVVDEDLDFGALKLGQGKAFSLGNQGARVPVYRQWVNWNGHRVLVEQSAVSDLKEHLGALPAAEGANARRQMKAAQRLALNSGLLPPPMKVESSPKPMELAKAGAPTRGVLLDYVTLLASETNYVFQGNKTYYISSTTTICGTNTCEGNVVFKYASNASIVLLSGKLDFLTEPYHVATFTAKDDQTVGERITGSLDEPAGLYADSALCLVSATDAQLIRSCRFVYAKAGVIVTSPEAAILDGQFVNCGVGAGVYGCTASFRNCLFSGTQTNFDLVSASVVLENCTLADSALLGSAPATYPPPQGLFLTNCILANVTNLSAGWLEVTGACNGFYCTTPFGAPTYTNTAYPFVTAAAGAYYLSATCVFTNAGTNVNPDLLQQLATKTTRAPVIYSNIFLSANTVLYPQAQRDVDQPDLGWHYNPIDYVALWCVISNSATLTISGGAVIAYGDTPGFGLFDNSPIISEGTPTAPNRFVNFHAVQEQPVKIGDGSSIPIGFYRPNGLGAPARFRFTEFSRPASVLSAYTLHANDGAKWNITSLDFADCRISGGLCLLMCSTGANFSATFANNILEGVAFDPIGYWSLSMRNNLFRKSVVEFDCQATSPWIVKDNAFDGNSWVCDLLQEPVSEDHNAFLNGCNLQFQSTNATDIFITNFVYAKGPLGNYYQLSTDLSNQGSCTAAQAGLYHHTVSTNNLPEGASTVDIGFHYIAVDTNGLPVDSDGGGVPNWMEDPNGDGTKDASETDFTNANDDDIYAAFPSLVTPAYLRCEYRVDPWGVDTRDPQSGITNMRPPRLFWIVRSDRRAAKQLAYQIHVASSPENLRTSVDVWDSGRVNSDRTIQVEYGSTRNPQALHSNQRLWWKVRTWDACTGVASPWSTNAFFQIGLVEPGDWQALWLTTPADPGEVVPIFRRSFVQVSSQIRRATAYVSAKGVYELWIDGQRVGNEFLAPNWTDYNKRIQYQTFDVAPHLIGGDTDGTNHVIGAIVGPGWFSGGRSDNNISYGQYTLNNDKHFLMQLVIELVDGTTRAVVTDNSWSYSLDGPIRSSSRLQRRTLRFNEGGALCRLVNVPLPGRSDQLCYIGLKLCSSLREALGAAKRGYPVHLRNQTCRHVDELNNRGANLRPRAEHIRLVCSQCDKYQPGERF